MDDLKIVDIILHKNECRTQMFIVLNRKPELLYEKISHGWLRGEEGGLFNFYAYERPVGKWKAFAGRKFEIPMKNGEVIEADGQWWDSTPSEYSNLLCHAGCASAEQLDKCYVFCGYNVDKEIVDTWLKYNDPSNNYNKYDQRHPDYGKQTIKSKWE